MGRGRAKAKQTKVARELKYFSPDTDLSKLAKELGSEDTPTWTAPAVDEGTDDDADDLYVDRYADDEESWAPKAG